jgi:hypothetical protein
MSGEDWRRLADYVVARRVELHMRDRRAFAEATGVTDRTLGKLENGQRVSPSTLGMIENQLGWAPGSCRRILADRSPSQPVTAKKSTTIRRSGISPVRRAFPPMSSAASSRSPGTGRVTKALAGQPPGEPDACRLL